MREDSTELTEVEKESENRSARQQNKKTKQIKHGWRHRRERARTKRFLARRRLGGGVRGFILFTGLLAHSVHSPRPLLITPRACLLSPCAKTLVCIPISLLAISCLGLCLSLGQLLDLSGRSIVETGSAARAGSCGPLFKLRFPAYSEKVAGHPSRLFGPLCSCIVAS